MNVKLKRIMMNLTQKQLATKVGTSNVTIGKIENGKIDSVQFGTLKKIAAALNCSMNELFLSE